MTKPFLANSESYKNVSLGLPLTAANNDDSWQPPSGEFAFDLEQVGDDGFLLAIWFNKIPEKTIVWPANRNSLIQRGTKVKLMEDGRLVLNDRKGKQIWCADIARSRVAYAAMLDTENFVLARHYLVNLWESFGEPTDTLFPTQIFNRGSKLVAGYSRINRSTGRFRFTPQADGNLMLYTLAFSLDFDNSAYWSGQTKGNGFQLIFNQPGNIYLAAKNGSILKMFSSESPTTQECYHIAILEYNGAFRH
ncbi:unnamed protein product [Dovyalis caffra]|uniref:Bulb-type lectin domain-containing protein n=1 Tax=Dovyalis caffra TaxID=77055 RepID=A0AAV1R5D0_9ROSI|nr:unnamed protein product [Dovyalis caffra]